MKIAEDKGNASRIAILDAAKEVFAEKGFDGARVDEIARRAKVNKALIYYYFESKDHILEELVQQSIKEGIDFRHSVIYNQPLSKVIESFNTGNVDHLSAILFEFAKKQKDIMSIIMIEALKGNTNGENFFKMIDMYIEDGVNRIKEGNGEIINYESYITMALFFVFIPLFNLVAFGEKWAEHAHLNYKAVETSFFDFVKKFYSDDILKEIIKI